MINVVLVDDQPLVRSGLKMILEAQDDIKVVAEAGDGISGVAICEQYRPDVALMDIRMPKLDGLEATRRLPHTRVLILTTFSLDEYVVGALRTGASGFLLKDATPEELIRAVRSVACGDAVLTPAVTKMVLDLAKVQVATPLKSFEVLADLSTRELEVLKLLARGLSNAELATELFVSESTIKTHISHLLSKLGLRDRVQAVIAAYELGVIERKTI